MAFSQNIKTIQLRPFGKNLYSAIVPMGTTLQLSFDDLDADSKTYQYKIEHMTHDWKPSGLNPSQYINGFEQSEILNLTDSFNTLQAYTHYEVNIPNQNTSITKSGNYLLSVLNEYDEVVFSRRFVLYENTVIVGVAAFRSRDTQFNATQQTIQFSVNHPNLQINNPTQEIKVALLQNDNWQTIKTGIQPQFFKPNQLLYKYTDQTTNFWGGNEFFNFDNKYVRNTSLKVGKVEQKDIFHNYLYADEPRTGKPYTYNPDINGQFVIRTLEGNNAQTEADYAMVHFSLDAFEPFENKSVYVYGAFNNFQLTPLNKMRYDKEAEQYKAAILLKQGFYNYKFVTLDSNGTLNQYEIGGSFYETENEYTAIIYYRPFGGLYDRVIGVGTGVFNQNR